MKQIDIDQFCNDVSKSPTLNNIQGTVNELVDRYSLGLIALLDKHAPIIQRVVSVRRHAPWYTESLRDTKRRRRRLERLWRHSKEDTDLLAHRQQCRSVYCVEDSLSQRCTVTSGVPQGSVLGDRLFTMYTYPLALIFNKYKVEYHSYPDDTQVYIHCDNNVASLMHAVPSTRKLYF